MLSFTLRVKEGAFEFGGRVILHAGSPLNVSDLISDGFIRKHSGYPTLREFFRHSPASMSNAFMTDAPQDTAFENFVRAHTDFNSWGSLVIAALEDYLARTYG